MTAWIWAETEIVRVVDGDTFDAKVSRDLGFGGVATFPVRLRLNRINAPAVHTSAGRLSRDFLASVLVPGSRVEVVTVGPYKYGGPEWATGEWMTEVEVGSLGNVSDLMVKMNQAVYWNGEGPRPHDELARAQLRVGAVHASP